MLNVYWKFANGARHFGHTGLDMLTYKVDADPTGYLEGLEFSPETSSSVCNRLEIDFAKEIRDKHSEGISYQQLLTSYCNRTMASEEILRKALISAMQAGEINVDGARGGTKRVDEINPMDVISPGTAPVLFVHPRQRLPKG